MSEELRRDFETWLRSDNPHACIDRCTIAGCNCGEYILERVEYKWEGYQAGRSDLTSQLAEVTAERDALKDDAGRVDWLEKLFSHSWSGTIGETWTWTLVGHWRHIVQNMRGYSFREAIDAAREGK